MSESGWLQIATLIVGLASMWISLHFKLKDVEKQNSEQEKKIEIVGETVKDTHREINSRLTEYRRLVEQKAVVDVAAALVAGEAKGVAKERERAGDNASAVLELARVAAEEVIRSAEAKARAK